MSIILKIEQERDETALVFRARLDSATLRWLLESNPNPAAMAASIVRMVMEDDRIAHSEAMPEVATLQ